MAMPCFLAFFSLSLTCPGFGPRFAIGNSSSVVRAIRSPRRRDSFGRPGGSARRSADEILADFHVRRLIAYNKHAPRGVDADGRVHPRRADGPARVPACGLAGAAAGRPGL